MLVDLTHLIKGFSSWLIKSIYIQETYLKQSFSEKFLKNGKINQISGNEKKAEVVILIIRQSSIQVKKH